VEERVDLMTLMNKPAVYGGDQRASSFGDMGGMSGGLGGGGFSGMPTLDLTSGMMAMAQRHQDGMGELPAGESTSQLPRPRESDCFVIFHTMHDIYHRYFLVIHTMRLKPPLSTAHQ
jgi:hypothetical protein